MPDKFAQSSSDPLAHMSLVTTNKDERSKLIAALAPYGVLLKSKKFSKPMTLWDQDQLQYLILWYINRNVDRAFQKAIHDNTSKQHTVPNFTNKSLGHHFNSQKTTKTIHNQTVDFQQGLQSVQGTYNYATRDWELDTIFNKRISVFRNIYDLNDLSLPPKLVECYLSCFETDAAEVVQRLHKNLPNQEITWGDRVILSCYATLQGIRTEIWKADSEKVLDKIAAREINSNPKLTKEAAKQKARNDLGIDFQHFGSSVFHALTFARINLFFVRKWSFLYAPDGLITSLHPVGSFDTSRFQMFTGGILNPSHLMIPLGRNLLWQLSPPDSNMTKTGWELTKGENRFVNEVFSINRDKIYCHPDDTEQIISKLYRTGAIEYYSSKSSWEIDPKFDPYQIEMTEDLLNYIPRRWQGPPSQQPRS